MGRLPMRTPLVPYPDRDGARTHDPAASPWWRSLDGDLGLPDAGVPGGPHPGPGRAGTGRWVAGRRVGHDLGARCLDDAGLRGAPLHERDHAVRRGPARGPGPEPHRGLPPDASPCPGTGAAAGSCCGSARRSRSWWSWWTGRWSASATDSRLPSEFDITDLVRPGRRSHRRAGGHQVVGPDVGRGPGPVVARRPPAQRDAALHRGRRTWRMPSSSPAWSRATDGHRTGTLDVEVAVAGPAQREPGWTVEVQVETAGRPGAWPRPGRWTCPCGTGTVRRRSSLSAMFVGPAWSRGRIEVRRVRAVVGRVAHPLPGGGHPVRPVGDGGGGRRGAHRLPVRRGARPRAADQRRARADPRGQPPRARPRPGASRQPGADPRRPAADEGPQPERGPGRRTTPTTSTSPTCATSSACTSWTRPNVESHGRQASLCHDPRYGRDDGRAGRAHGAPGQAPPVDDRVVARQRVGRRAAPRRRGRRLPAGLRPDPAAALRGPADARPARPSARSPTSCARCTPSIDDIVAGPAGPATAAVR